MSIELAAYGAFSGLFYNRLKEKKSGVLVSLLLALLFGRICWAIASWILYPLLCGYRFTFSMFLAGAFVQAWPGILLQLVLIPILLKALQNRKNAGQFFRKES